MTQLTLVAGLQRTATAATASSINANVAAATHGRDGRRGARRGDASKPYQGFTLRQPPLTFVRNDATPTGAASTLELRVNDLRWDEVPFFYGRGPAERVFTTRHRRRRHARSSSSATASTARGCRPARRTCAPTYRKGVGTAGNVQAGQLTTLLTRPLGLKAAQNPVPAVGGDDPEPRDAARENAPLTVLTLDRVVSLLDYEDFARAFAGIAKALATWSWDGQRRGVFVTVAAPDGDPVADDVLEKLEAAIRKAGDPFVPLRLKSYRAGRLPHQVQGEDRPGLRQAARARGASWRSCATASPSPLAPSASRWRSPRSWRRSRAWRASSPSTSTSWSAPTASAAAGSTSRCPPPCPSSTSLGGRRGRRAAHPVARSDRARRHAMSFDAQRLFELLPAIYRLRDGQAQHPDALRALIDVIAEQVAVLEEDLAQLYDDQFIETCAEWVVPYIGDLIGYRSLHAVAPRIGSPRAEVANTIAYRRRKGTASMLEQLARDVTGWDARVVEFFQLLATTQYMNHLAPPQHRVVRRAARGGPAARSARLRRRRPPLDVRRIARRRGRYNIPNVGIFLWRLGDHPLERIAGGEAAPRDAGDRRYLFSPLGADTPLFNAAEAEDTITHLADARQRAAADHAARAARRARRVLPGQRRGELRRSRPPGEHRGGERPLRPAGRRLGVRGQRHGPDRPRARPARRCRRRSRWTATPCR